MRIKYLELYKYKRFPLLGNDRFVMDFTHKLNLILGINGCGKSSLISELSPLPAPKDDYYEGGSKTIVIDHKGVIFTLISDIDKNEYHFIMGEQELNPSYLISIQRDLVYAHFGLNQDIWDILIGKTSFTDMPLIARKKLFNTLSHLNIETILDIYSEQKEQHKQQQLLHKTQSNLYAIEANKLLDSSLLTTLNGRLDKNNEAINALLDIRSMLASHLQGRTNDENIEKYKTLAQSIQALKLKYYTVLTSFPYKNYEANKALLTSKVNLCQMRLQDLYKKIEGFEYALKSIELKKSKSKKEMEDKLVELRLLVDSHRTKLVYVKNHSGSILADIDTMYYALSEIVSEMPLNADKHYSKTMYGQVLERKSSLLEKSQANYNRVIYLTKQIDILNQQKEDNSVICPACSHQWVMNYDQRKHNLLIKEKEQEDINTIQFAKSLEEVNVYLQEFTDYMGKYKIYAHIRETYKDKFPLLFDEIDKSQYIYTSPRSILTLVNTAISDVNSLVEIERIEISISSLEKDLEIVTNADIGDSDSIHKEMEQTISDINDLLEEKQTQSVYLQYNELGLKIATHLLKIEDSLLATRQSILYTNLSQTLQQVITSVDTELNNIRVQNIDIQSQLSNHSSINTVIDKYKKDIEDTAKNIEVLKIIMHELNPKTGIIGKIISNYLNSIIVFVNKIISSLWNYKMELVVYNLESDALDYRFKINVEDKLSVKDISLASSGMKEVINLAFKLALMKLLNLEHYPLYLDEFGARLDSEHKSNIYNLIFKFLNDDNYSQIYLITHTDLSYSNFKDTKVIQLS